MRDNKEQDVEISFGEGCVVLRRSGSSTPKLAGILGTEQDPETGSTKVWLDRLVHRRGESTYREGATLWSVSGAISTILTKH